jgi:hypothetical protein
MTMMDDTADPEEIPPFRKMLIGKKPRLCCWVRGDTATKAAMNVRVGLLT